MIRKLPCSTCCEVPFDKKLKRAQTTPEALISFPCLSLVVCCLLSVFLSFNSAAKEWVFGVVATAQNLGMKRLVRILNYVFDRPIFFIFSDRLCSVSFP